MAIVNIITFLIHAIAGAFASLLMAVFKHLVPTAIAIAAAIALVFALCTSCGIGGVAMLRRRRKQE